MRRFSATALVAVPLVGLWLAVPGSVLAKPPGNSDCDTKHYDFGSGPTLVQTRSRSCITDNNNGTASGSAESLITFCPPGWNDLQHSVELQVDIPPASPGNSGIVICFDQDEKLTSAPPASAYCGGSHHNAMSASTYARHTYQVTTGNPSDVASFTTRATVLFGADP